MAFADGGSLGATGSTGNNQSSLALTTAAAVAAGDLVVVVVAVDNNASGGDSGVSGVADAGGNTYSKAIQIQNAVAAQGGASCSIWWTQATTGFSAQANGITATFNNATTSDASGLTARKFTKASGNNVAVEGTPGTLVGNTAADPGSLNVTTANIECLRVRGIASQVGNNTNLTPTASWTAWANGNSATTGTTGEMCARAESRIFTGTGAASDPTYVSAIYASCYVAFKEVLAPHNLDADDFTTAAPVLDTPDLTVDAGEDLLDSSPLTTAAPVIATPTTFTQTHVLLDVDLLTAAPVFTAPTLTLVSALEIGDRVLDNGLAVLDTEADAIYICNDFPSTYAEATSTFALGHKNFGVGLVFTAPAAGTPAGRVITSNAVVGGTVTVTGTPQCWAVVDSVNSRLLAVGPASGFSAVTAGWSWTLGQIPIHMDG